MRKGGGGEGVRTNSTIRGQNGASANNLLELNVLLLPANRLKLHSNKLQIRIFLYYPNKKKKKSCILFFVLPRVFFFFFPLCKITREIQVKLIIFLFKQKIAPLKAIVKYVLTIDFKSWSNKIKF